MFKIAIFPGHIGKDPGAIDDHDPEPGADEFYSIESVVNGQIAVLLKAKLDNMAIHNKLFIGEFDKRLKDSESYDIGVSIHCDSFPLESAQGFTVYHYPGSGIGQAFAKMVNEEMVIRTSGSILSRGVKSAEFYILKKTKFPTILLEAGFLSNPAEERLLLSYNYQNRVAESLSTAIQKVTQKPL